jgi:hypothetical protein
MIQVHREFNEKDLGHGATETILHPVVIVAVVISIVLMLWRPRKYAIVPFLLCCALIPRGQLLYLAGAHFYMRTLVTFVVFVRAVTGKFNLAGGFNIVDKIFLVWACYRYFSILVTNWPNGIGEQTAFFMSCLWGYFALRCLLQNEEDFIRAAKTLAIATIILGPFMLYENRMGVNLFGAYLGGVEAVPEVRNGMARAQATFGHAILAGCFGATLLPLFVWLWKKHKPMAMVGIVGSSMMVFTTESSTPLMAYLAGILSLCCWPIRNMMRFIRWGIVAIVLGVALVMNAPVWFIIAHIDPVGNSGGWDRAMLIDTCVRHFGDWWLHGTNQMGGWGFDMWDLSDQFVAEAEVGGILTITCFIAIIAISFSRLGKMRRRADGQDQWLLWCLGAVLTAHIFSYFGVSYWDQTQVWWFAGLAMISASTAPLNSKQSVEVVAPVAKKSLGFRNPVQASRRSVPPVWR